MAKDYFQDILPPQGGGGGRQRPAPPLPHQEELQDEERFSAEAPVEPARDARSIRNITVSSRAARRPVGLERDTTPPPRRKGGSKLWMWGVAFVLILILALILLVAVRPSSITVVPRSQVVVFDSSMQFSAYPNSTTPGELSYTMYIAEFEDSKIVTASGAEEVEEKARGTITIINNYSADPVRLIATTRFETPEGLVFRITEDVSVPGKKGAIPGELSVNVIADETGEKYNVGPVNKFTLPGLKGNAAMYADVYARSTSAMTGGFMGERPVVTQADEEAARSEIRDRLEQKVREAVAEKNTGDSIALLDLAKITYAPLPTFPEGQGSARIRESAKAEIVIFAGADFAQTVAKGVSADAEQSSVFLKNPESLRATLVEGEEPQVPGSTPITFTLSGTGQIVWNVDVSALAEALAGREEGAFEAIVASFPGIDEARARIQPFWKSSFPEDPLTIQVRLEEPVPLDSL